MLSEYDDGGRGDASGPDRTVESLRAVTLFAESDMMFLLRQFGFVLVLLTLLAARAHWSAPRAGTNLSAAVPTGPR